MKRNYEITDGKASPFGGFHAISELLDNIHFDELFVKHFGKLRKTRKYHPVETLKLLISMILAGGERITDIYRLRNDPVIPDLFGNGSVPYDTTVRNDLLLMSEEFLAREEFLLDLNNIVLKKSQPKSMTIDIDGTFTPVYGHQAMASRGYNSARSLQRGFQVLLISWNEMNSPLFIDTHAGNRHCSFGAKEAMKKVLDYFSDKVETLYVRADSGFYGDEFLELLESYENVFYVVKTQKNYTQIDSIADECFKYYHDNLRQFVTYQYSIGNSVERTYFVERRYKGESIVLYLFDELYFQYEVIVSNIPNMQPHSIFHFYNNRARQEKLISELKNEFALGKIVSNEFGVTQCGNWIAAVSCAIIAIFREVALRREFRKYRMKLFRYYFLNVVAYKTTHARRKTIKILCPPIGRWRYDQVIKRIHALS